jgi:hypothetical protein
MRPPEVFVRELAPHEGQRLKHLSKRSKLASTRQRASILLASATLMSAPQIARMWMTDESHVRKVIHDFNEHGFESLRLQGAIVLFGATFGLAQIGRVGRTSLPLMLGTLSVASREPTSS